jgi:ParB family chromosome partitioning protein
MADNNTKNRLGRGLAALIGDIEAVPQNESDQSTIKADLVAPIELVRANPNNPRRMFRDDELQDLSQSISQHGIVQPILVRSVPRGEHGGVKYEIIAGERRWRAAQKAGIHEIPILIREGEDRQALEIAIIENVQRADLNAVEEASGYRRLKNEYGYSQNDLAQIIGKSRSHVANTLRLLKLPDEVRQMIVRGELSAGHARTLITAEDPAILAKRIVRDGLSVRQAEELLKAASDPASKNPRSGKSAPQKNADIIALENRLGNKLGLNVSVSYQNGCGNVKIFFKKLEQLDEICSKLEQ